MWYRNLEMNPSPGNNTNHEFIWCYNIICSSREVGTQRDKRTDIRAISRRVCNCNIEILPLGGSREPGKWFSSRLTCEPQSPMLGNIYWNIFTGISKLYQNNNKILLPQISFRNVACEVAHRGKVPDPQAWPPEFDSWNPSERTSTPEMIFWLQ